uniref:NADH dehydrogenase [ubiquinone] 1 beta subcomplex subunit 10 n=1 Tax=Macrostomum lignano TaxID=282301 RepID=A0A1I8F6G8_9PLAT
MGGGHEPEPTRESLYTPVTSKAFTDTWLFKAFDLPTTWFKENVIDKVPTIDQCFVDDELCNLEADEQYKRDRLVDQEIVNILRRRRREQCFQWYGRQRDLIEKHCGQIQKDYDEARLSDRKSDKDSYSPPPNYFIKHGDMGYAHNVKNAPDEAESTGCWWERKYGEVGSRGDPNKYPNVIDMEPGTLSTEDQLELRNMRKFGNNHESKSERDGAPKVCPRFWAACKTK